MSTTPLPDTIRVVLQPGKTSHRLIMKPNQPMPSLSRPDDVLIKVAATSPCLGELDWAADLPHIFTEPRDPVPGQDVAGTVVSVGSSNNAGFVPGQEVFGRIKATRPGGCRDYAVVRADELAAKPAGLGWNEAVATPLSALTAWQALFYQGPLKKEAILENDQDARKANANLRVFIAGAGTSVGMWAVQFASLAGAADIISLCSGSKADLMREFGATELVDYTQTTTADWASRNPGKEVDLMLDCVGGNSMSHLWSVVRDGGVFLSICRDPIEVRPEGNGKTLKKATFFIMDSLGWQLAELAPYVESGRVRPLVDSVYPFESFAEAFEKVEGRRAKGKVVIRISE